LSEVATTIKSAVPIWLALKTIPRCRSRGRQAALLRGNASWSRDWMFNIVRGPIFSSSAEN
jgi:hypothetical protein